jgi:hypothetical protein
MIIRRPKKKAKKIIEEAEEQAQKRAQKKDQVSGRKALEKARQDAEQMRTRAQKTVNREKTEAGCGLKRRAREQQFTGNPRNNSARDTLNAPAEAVIEPRKKPINRMCRRSCSQRGKSKPDPEIPGTDNKRS